MVTKKAIRVSFACSVAFIFLACYTFSKFFWSNAFGLNIKTNRNIAVLDYNELMEKYTSKEVLRHQQGMAMDDPGLIKFIQQRYLVFPSGKNNSEKTEEHYSQEGQSKFIDKFLKGKRNGFFIESGAADGVKFSNSLFFENFRGWSGLLVEPQTSFFQGILKNRPGSFAINGCLSTTTQSSRVSFDLVWDPLEAAVSQYANKQKTVSSTTVQCFPLFSMLQAIGVSTIDYFSLDVEGPELEILQTIPWDKVQINVLSIEYKATPGTPNSQNVTETRLANIRGFFKQLGVYEEVNKVPLDVFFARKELIAP